MQSEISGTPAYMSPEQAEGKKADERTDVFAFGAVLYEMLSGRRAFRGDSPIAVLGAVMREEPPPLTGVPRDLVRLVTLCLRKDPARRLRNIEDVKIELQEVSERSPRLKSDEGGLSHWAWLPRLSFWGQSASGGGLAALRSRPGRWNSSGLPPIRGLLRSRPCRPMASCWPMLPTVPGKTTWTSGYNKWAAGRRSALRGTPRTSTNRTLA